MDMGNPGLTQRQNRTARLRSIWFWWLAGLLLSYPILAQQRQRVDVASALSEGNAAMRRGDFQTAISKFEIVTHAMPQFAEGQLNLGIAEEQAGDYPRALKAFSQALKLKPSLPGANLFSGIIEYRLNNFPAAEAAFQRETHIAPRNAKAWMWLGVAELAEDHPEEAVRALDAAYKLNPQDPDVLYHRGRAYLLVSKACYSEMYKLAPHSWRVHDVLGQSDAEAYRTENAIQDFEQAIQAAPSEPGLHEELGDQEWIAGKFDDAAKAYKAELSIDPNATNARYKLGSLLVTLHKAEEGLPLLQTALRTDPTLKDAYYYLGMGEAQIGQDEKAILDLKTAISTAPHSGRAEASYYQLSRIYRREHRTEETADALKNFLALRAANAQHPSAEVTAKPRRRSDLPMSTKYPENGEPLPATPKNP